MAYSADSFTALEIPTLAKMNKLWTNDASFNDGTGIADDKILARHILNNSITKDHIDWAAATGKIWWEELGRTTLASPADSVDLSFTPKKYLKIYLNFSATGGTVENAIRINNDSANSYATRISTNGGADGTSVNQNRAQLAGEFAYSFAGGILEVVNVIGTEKDITVQRFGNFSGTSTSAGSAPDRAELAIKWANTAQQISRITMVNTTGTGDFAAGATIVVLGHD